MSEKTQNRLIVLALVLAGVALLWGLLRNTPGVGNIIKGLESGQWVPPMGSVFNVESPGGGDIIIEPLTLAPWSPISAPVTTGGSGSKDNCGCNAFICKPSEGQFNAYPLDILNLATYSMPYGGNIYMGY